MSFAEALRQKRPGRIHDLAPEVERHTEDGVYFDVEKEVGDVEWYGILEELKRYDRDIGNGETQRETLLRYIIDLARLRPDKLAEIRRIDTKNIFDTRLAIPGIMKRSFAVGKINVLSVARIFGRYDELGRFCTDEVWQNYLAVVDDLYGMGMVEESLMRWGLLCSVDINRAQQERSIDEQWDNWRAHGLELRRSGKIATYAQIISTMKMLRPEKFRTFDIADDWRVFKVNLEACRERHLWDHFSTFTSAMQILAAEAVVMTDHGLECVPKKKQTHQEHITPRPVRQNF